MKKVLFKINELIATFWFIPIGIIIGAILLAMGLISIEQNFEVPSKGIGIYFFVKNADSARSILATISAAMIGVAGTVFSVTLVALTLASSQFGPRLVKNFMYVRLNQIVLGSYISTYLYCLLVLNAIKDTKGESFIPSVSILVAIFAAIVNIVLLIVFIHQIAISIQADSVISNISEVLSSKVKILYPSTMGTSKEGTKEIQVKETIASYKNKISLKITKSGYMQYIDGTALILLLSKNNQLLDLNFRPGAFLVKGTELGTLYTNADWTEKDFKRLNGHFVIGTTKTFQQDIEFSVHQMVEIASRSLSPGINDPYTAIACINNLTSTLVDLAQTEFPSKYRYDNKGNLRVITDIFSFEGILGASFNQIRQYASGSPSVIIRLMEALIIVYDFSKIKKDREAITEHANMVLRAGEQHFTEKNDLKDLRVRSKKILE